MMKPSEDIWWYKNGSGERVGPFSREKIGKLFDSGDIDSPTLYWSSSKPRWLSFDHQIDQKIQVNSLFVWRRWAVLIVVTIMFWALMIEVGALLYTGAWTRIPIRSFHWIWPAIGCGLALTTFLGAALWLNLADAFTARSEFSVMIKIAAVILAISGVTVAAVELRGTRNTVAMAQATADWTYWLRPDPARHRLIVTGQIGPGFGRAFTRELAGVSGPVTIEIDSTGGLVDEALLAAKAVQARESTTVLVPHYCISACLIVLMGGDKRLAEYRAELSFHSPASVTRLEGAAANWTSLQSGREADAYLRSRGVPGEVIAQTNRLGSTRLNHISVVEALRRQILTGAVADGLPLEPDEARRRLIRWQNQHPDQESQTSFSP